MNVSSDPPSFEELPSSFFGYSFYLAWVAFALQMLNVLFNLLGFVVNSRNTARPANVPSIVSV